MHRVTRALLGAGLLVLPVFPVAAEMAAAPDPRHEEAAAPAPQGPSGPVAATLWSLAEQFRLSAGVRYWYSTERINFAFANRLPGYGDPTSTLDWARTTAHSGEAFARLDHTPTGLFLKGVGGGGGITGSGDLTDRDYASGQRTYSATRSSVQGAGLTYGITDLGVAFAPAPKAAPGLRIGPFVGYHLWQDNPIARGVVCEPTDLINPFCPPPATAVLVPASVKVIGYAARWDALRLGVSAAMPVPRMARLSVRGEVAWVPYARYAVDDSHYLRRDLGPTPNAFFRGRGRGVEAELFLDYAVTERFGLGLGGRYWGLFADGGEARIRPSPARYPMTRYDQQRYGLLLEAKYRF